MGLEFCEEFVELEEGSVDGELVGADEFDNFTIFGVKAFFEFVDAV